MGTLDDKARVLLAADMDADNSGASDCTINAEPDWDVQSVLWSYFYARANC